MYENNFCTNSRLLLSLINPFRKDLIIKQFKNQSTDISPNLYSMIENMYKRKMVERAKIVIAFGVDPLISE